jgi:hypothetical protein
MSLNFEEFYNNIKSQYDIPTNTDNDLLDVLANSQLYLELKTKELELLNNPTYEKFCHIFTEYEHESSDDELDEEPEISYTQILQSLSKRKEITSDIIRIYTNLIFVLNDILDDRNKLKHQQEDSFKLNI